MTHPTRISWKPHKRQACFSVMGLLAFVGRSEVSELNWLFQKLLVVELIYTYNDRGHWNISVVSILQRLPLKCLICACWSWGWFEVFVLTLIVMVLFLDCQIRNPPLNSMQPSTTPHLTTIKMSIKLHLHIPDGEMSWSQCCVGRQLIWSVPLL